MPSQPLPKAWQQRKLVLLAQLFPFFERLGVHVTPNHFYEPIPELRSLPDSIFEREFELVGVDLREKEQLELLARVGELRDEFANWGRAQPSNGEATYYYDNGQFGPVDAEILYAMIRFGRPRRIIEIGSGFSTLVTLQAIAMNKRRDSGYDCQVTCVEPYPRDFLRELAGQITLVEGKVQDQPLELFASLGDGDILFIDSSHVLKIGSDVQYEFLEVLPRVSPGAVVHIHDIFFPTEYPPAFIKEWKLFWTEQYLVQSFLQFNEVFEVRWSGSWMSHQHPDEVRSVFPALGTVANRPSSLWLQRVRV